MFVTYDHIDTLIAADWYYDNGQNLFSEAMRLLNRPCLEFWSIGCCEKSITKSSSFRKSERSINKSKYKLTKSYSKAGRQSCLSKSYAGMKSMSINRSRLPDLDDLFLS